MVIENIKDHLREISRQAKSGEISLEKFIIRKTLSKDPESYPDKNSQPHVLVALSLKTKGIIVRAKDTIPYVICNLPDQNYDTFCHRALHYDEALRKKLEPG